jgi:hypothetical protein
MEKDYTNKKNNYEHEINEELNDESTNLFRKNLEKTRLKLVYETEFKPLYNEKRYEKAFEIFSKNKNLNQYLSPTEKRFMTLELKKKMHPQLELTAMFLISELEHKN